MPHEILIYILTLLLGTAIASAVYALIYSKRSKAWQEEKEELQRAQIEHQVLLTAKDQEIANEHMRRKEQLQAQQESFERQLREMDSRFAVLSEEITKKRTDELTATNRQALDALLTPLKENIDGMKIAFEANKRSASEQSGNLNRAILDLMRQATEVGNKADNLSNALRGKGKIQGDWGEAKLEALLQAEDFIKEEMYTTQENFKDDEGKSLRPDFVLYYPDNTALVVDSKVSLTAYADHFEIEDEALRAAKADEHLRSVRNHIQQLARKEYAKYIVKPTKALDFVVMFVPIHGALQLALDLDPTLWRFAMDRGVLIATESSLMALLKVIRLSWRQHNSEKNMEQITKQGELMLKRVTDFYKEFENIGFRINQLQQAYELSDRKLQGNQGILTSARKLEELGLKNNSTNTLPLLPTQDEE